MPEPDPARGSERETKRNLLQRLVEFIRPSPESTDELIETLAEAEDKAVIDGESRLMLEGVLHLADMTAGDAMVAAPRMDLLDIDDPYDVLLARVIDTAHSRFPVYQTQRENIIGILLAKDLLKLQRAPELNIRALLRAAVFIPESKGLNDLLREFRATHNHLAIVVDEFGRTAGLITIEDVLEDRLDDPIQIGRPLRVVYGTQPDLFTAETDNITVTGLPASCADVLMLGVVAKQVPGLDISRAQLSSVEQSDRSRVVPPNAGVNAARYLMAEYQERLANEARALRKQYRPRIVRTF